MCKMLISPVVFSLFLILIFWPVMGRRGGGLKGKFCLLCFASQEPYIIWLPFIAHLCTMISSHAFSIFSKFWISGLLGEWKGKKWSKMKNNNYICHAPYLRIACDHDFWYTCVKWRYLLAFFSFFQNFDFLGC